MLGSAAGVVPTTALVASAVTASIAYAACSYASEVSAASSGAAIEGGFALVAAAASAVSPRSAPSLRAAGRAASGLVRRSLRSGGCLSAQTAALAVGGTTCVIVTIAVHAVGLSMRLVAASELRRKMRRHAREAAEAAMLESGAEFALVVVEERGEQPEKCAPAPVLALMLAPEAAPWMLVSRAGPSAEDGERAAPRV
jgi:hypothetical protein